MDSSYVLAELNQTSNRKLINSIIDLINYNIHLRTLNSLNILYDHIIYLKKMD